jgi:MoaA/NifB/PqqE/SkfB family radical SAM enzyme
VYSDQALNPYKIVHHDLHRRFPVHIEVDPTAFCNHDCVRCSYTQEIDGPRKETIYQQGHVLNDARFIELLDEFTEIGMRAITFSGGGEPLTHPNINGMLKSVIDHKLEFGVITNLSVAVDMDLLGKATWVRVSLDAATKQTHTFLHRPRGLRQDFDRVTSNICALRKANDQLDIGLNFIIQPENYLEIFDAAALGKELGASYIRFVPAISTTPLDYSKIWGEISQQQEKALSLCTNNFTVQIQKERFSALANSKKNYSSCHKQRIHPLLGADGIIYPCCQLKYYPQHNLGSIYEGSFREVWEGTRRAEWLKALDVSQCPTCWFDKTNELIEYMLMDSPPHVNFV